MSGDGLRQSNVALQTRLPRTRAAGLCIAVILGACSGDDEAGQAASSTTSTLQSAISVPVGSDEGTTLPDEFGATAAAGYIKGLVATDEVPHSSEIVAVRAEGEVVVIETSLIDRTRAVEISESLGTTLRCDDSFPRVRGWQVVLKDGSAVDQSGPDVQLCAGT